MTNINYFDPSMLNIGEVSFESNKLIMYYIKYIKNLMTNISDFDLSLLVIDQVSFRSDELIMYYIKYIKDLNSSNPLYLVF